MEENYENELGSLHKWLEEESKEVLFKYALLILGKMKYSNSLY